MPCLWYPLRNCLGLALPGAPRGWEPRLHRGDGCEAHKTVWRGLLQTLVPSHIENQKPTSRDLYRGWKGPFCSSFSVHCMVWGPASMWLHLGGLGRCWVRSKRHLWGSAYNLSSPSWSLSWISIWLRSTCIDSPFSNLFPSYSIKCVFIFFFWQDAFYLFVCFVRNCF